MANLTALFAAGLALAMSLGCAYRSEVDGDGGPIDAGSGDARPLTAGVSTLAGGGAAGLVDGDRAHARFNDPVNCVVSPEGRVFVADFNNGAIREITPEGDVTTLTHQTGFDWPFGMIFGDDGTFYVETDKNTSGALLGALWKIDRVSGHATLVTNNFGRFRGMARLSDGRFVMAEYQAHYLAIFNPRTFVLTPLAGKKGMAGFADGQGESARFNTPYDVVVLPGDVILVADFGNHRIRVVYLDGRVDTFAGTSESANRDGDVHTARFVTPQGLARDGEGNIYVSDPGAHRIRLIAGDQVMTIAGDGQAGYVESLDPMVARFYGIEGLDILPDGQSLYIADGNLGDGSPYHRVRRLKFE